MKTVPVNGRRLRAAITDLQVAERTFARAINIGERSIRMILNDNRMLASLTLAEVSRIADEAGITVLELLTPDIAEADTHLEPDDLPNADERNLHQLLRRSPTRHKEETLAVALTWSLDRLRDAAQELDTHLRPLGEHIHANTMGLKIIATDEAADTATRRLATLHDADIGLDANTARVLYAVYNRTYSRKRSGQAHLKHLAALATRGFIQLTSAPGRRVQPTDAVSYAFEP